MAINYTKATWVNGAPPALSAENINHMDDGIKQACDAIDSLNTIKRTKDAGWGDSCLQSGCVGDDGWVGRAKCHTLDEQWIFNCDSDRWIPYHVTPEYCPELWASVKAQVEASKE